MRNSDRLAQFVEASLKQHQSRNSIFETLETAGWSHSEISQALAAWSESENTPPVPKPIPYVSAKESFLYALSFFALGMTVFHITWLGFSLIDLLPPESGRYLSNNHWSTSAIVVFLPIFLFMKFKVLKDANKDPAGRRSTVRKWFGYTTLFIAAIVLSCDMIVALDALLGGDLRLKFGLKAGLLGVVSAVVFLYFRREMQEAEEL